jgi:D-2-hydroxyacid dehydrogenase (NADP+)
MPQVVVLQNFSEESRRRFRSFFDLRFPDLAVSIVGNSRELLPLMADAEVLISFGKPLGPDADQLIARATKLKWIQSLGTGVDNIVDLPSLRDDVIVTNMRGIHGPSMSEAALFLMQALARQFPRSVFNQSRCRWERWPASLLHRKTVGILGVGAIAVELARRCKALGMHTVGITSTRRDIAEFDNIYTRADILTAVSHLDFLVVLLPFTQQNQNAVDSKVLGAMKRSAYLVNLARGGIVDERALIDTLRAKMISGAALDVFEIEPLPVNHPLWTIENLIITPHTGGYSDDYDDQALPIIEANLRNFLAGRFEQMINAVRR